MEKGISNGKKRSYYIFMVFFYIIKMLWRNLCNKFVDWDEIYKFLDKYKLVKLFEEEIIINYI